jgi:pyruvate formate lyase activating enzyme
MPCPQGINIPKIFKSYDTASMFGDDAGFRKQYNEMDVNASACVSCGACVSACRGGYRKIIGERWTADALAKRLMKDADVYALSGGGVTFSGGEPLAQWGFVSQVIQELSGVHTAVETSGYAPDSVFEDAMARCSLIMLDWKVSDPALHKRYTGVEQEVILRHARMLAQGDTPFILRMPVIPGVNDNRTHFVHSFCQVVDCF